MGDGRCPRVRGMPLRRFRVDDGCVVSVTGHSASPREVTVPLDVFPDSIGSAISVPRSLHDLSQADDLLSMIAVRARRPACAVPRGIPDRAGRPSPKRRTVTSSGLRPLQGMTTALAAHHRGGCHETRAHAVPPGVSSSTALEEWGVHVTSAGLASPDYGPSAGFRTLLTVCSAPLPPGLFHPGGALEVPPFRAFPPRRAETPLGARCLPDVHVRDPTRHLLRRRHAPRHGTTRRYVGFDDRKPRALAFKALLPSKIRCRPAAV